MLNKTNIFLVSILPISVILGNFAINLNIILIDILMLFLCFKDKNWRWLKNIYFKILITIYFYLVINSIFNYFIDKTYGLDGIFRSIGFIKFILLGFSLNILIRNNKHLETIFISWLTIVVITILDVFYEFYFGQNILGFQSLDGTRIISFFYDENVVGGYLLVFSFASCTYFINKNYNNKKKLLLNILFFLIPLSILFTGERSNFYKCILLFSIILFMINSNYLILSKKKISLFLIFGILISVFVNQNLYIKQTEFFKRILIVDNPQNFMDQFQNIQYFSHYDAAINIFYDYPINGVGNKNFRKKCLDEKYFKENLKFSVLRCSTHPHQIHFELLSEQGLIGYLLFFYFIIKFILNNLRTNYSTNNIYIYIINFYLIIFLIPLLPSGSLFSSFNGALFWIIFSLANFNNKKFK